MSKVEQIREEILEKIRTGYFPRGSMLPPERKLAELCHVSHMTMHKALGLLVKEGYLEARVGQGTMVRSSLDESRVQRQLGILASSWEAIEHNELLGCAAQSARRRNWIPRVFHANGWDEKAVEAALTECDAVFAFGLDAPERLPDRLNHFKNPDAPPLVILGNYRTQGFDTVCAPEEVGLRLLVDYLAKAGHHRVAFAFQLQSQADWEADDFEPMVQAWRNACKLQIGTSEYEERKITFFAPSFSLPHGVLADELLRRARKNGGKFPFSVLVVPLSYAWGAIYAIRQLGLRIPEDLSLVMLGDRQEADFYLPKPTRLSNPYAEHILEAWKIVDARLAREIPLQPCQGHVQPRILPGETVKILI